MKTYYTVGLSMLAGIGIGAVAVQTLHAQAKPKAYLVSETELLDQAALDVYAPKAAANVLAAGGKSGIVPTNGRIVGKIGEPPKRFGVSEWPSLDQLEAYYTSPQRKELDELRAKAFKTVRQFMVEAK